MSPDATQTSLGTGRILADGTVLSDRYRILRLLGVGGMGMVYLAHDEQLDVDVALKILRADGAASEMRLERFRSELILARQISHRNVVRIHDIGQSDELHYITMDYVDGQSLKHVLELEGALNAERTTAIAVDLADALAEAHHAEIVHRDIKPANVLISDDHAYLTDFGIARSLHAEGLTRTGEVVGTLDYLSPEQARGEAVDGRADIYALGLLLFEMLTGRRPFSGETAEEVLAQRTLANPRDLTAGSDAIPPQLRPIIRRCLAVDPQDRYQNASDLATDLRAGSASRQWRRPLQTAATVTFLAIAGYAVWAVWPAGEVAQQAASDAFAQPIAVLPFDVAVSNADLASISHGLAELLAEQLSSGGAVQIVASQRVNATLRDLKLMGKNLTPSDQALLGDLLDADYLILGRLQQIDDNYHIEVRLRRAVSGDVISRSSFDVSNASGIFATIGPLAGELLSNLDVSREQTPALTSLFDPQVLGAYAAGVEFLSQGNALDAVEPLRSAVRDAPDFALAWDRLALALSSLGQDRQAIAAAESAVAALDGDAGRTGALVRARKEALAGNPENAISELDTLLRKHPGDIEVSFMLAEVYGDAGRFQDAEAALQRVVASSPDHPQAWYLLGKFSILRGDARRAVDDYLVKALVIQNRLESDQGKADVLNAIGIARAQLGEADEASDYYRQALDLRQRIGDERGVAAVMANLARISLREGRYDQAHDELIGARNKLLEIGDRWTVANLENELGFLEEQRGRFEQALEHYREGLRIRDDLGDQRALAESYNNVGYIYYLLGEYDNAAVFNERSLDTYRDTDNSEGIMHASQIRGILETARGRYDVALKFLLESLQTSRDIDDVHAEAVTEGYIGRARFLQGQYSAAKESYASALQKLAALGDDRGLAEFTLHDATLSLETGMLQEAWSAIERARVLLAGDDNAAGRAALLRNEGMYFAVMGDRAKADASFAGALREAKISGEKVAILQVRLAAARSDSPACSGELSEIHAASTRLGHGPLEVESAIKLARCYLAENRPTEANQMLRGTGKADLAASGFRGDYQIQALLAEISQLQGQIGESRAAWQRAGNAVQRAMNAQDPGQQVAFAQLATVRRVLEQQESRDEN